MRFEDRGKNTWKILTADMNRYAGTGLRPWSFRYIKRLFSAAYEHPGLIAVVVFRYGQWVDFRVKFPVVRQILDLIYYGLYSFVRFLLQIEIPRTSTIDAGLMINHYGGILINSQIIAGRDLTITHGVLVGQTDTGIPRLGDGVVIGVGSKVIGGITLGNNVQVGAGAVVTKSFPDNAIIAGVPARLLRFRELQPSAEEEMAADAEDPAPAENAA